MKVNCHVCFIWEIILLIIIQSINHQAYFYCCNKKNDVIHCKASAQAIIMNDDEHHERFILSKINLNHSVNCLPNNVLLLVRKTKDAFKQRIQGSPSIKPSVVYIEEVNRIRDCLSEADKLEFDQMMPTQTTLNPSIFAWKRVLWPPNPDLVSKIDIECDIFQLNGENICKFKEEVGRNPNRIVFGFTSNKVMEASLGMSKIGVMDATFDCCPNLFSQLFIVSTCLGGIIWRPMLYAFMPDKFTDTYDTLFSAFSGLMHMNNWWWKDDFKMKDANISGAGTFLFCNVKVQGK